MTRRKVILPYWTIDKNTVLNKDTLNAQFSGISQGEVIINYTENGGYLTVLDSAGTLTNFDSSKIIDKKISESIFATSAYTDSQIAGVQGQIDAVERDVTGLSTSLNALSSTTSTFSANVETEIERLEGDIATAKGEAISAISALSSTVVSEIGRLDDRVDSAFTSAITYTENNLKDYATKAFVTDKIVSALTNGTIDLTGYAKTEDVKAAVSSAKTEAIADASAYADAEIAKLSDVYDVKGAAASAEAAAKKYTDDKLNEEISNINQIIEDNEKVSATALNELNSDIKELYKAVNDKAEKSEISNINQIIEENERVCADSISELNNRINNINTKTVLASTNEKCYLIGYSSKEGNTQTLNTSSTDVYMENGELFAVSDETLKDFGSDIDIDLNKLAELPKVYYSLKNDADKKQMIGTSAQKLREIYPELVSEDANGKLAVSYEKLSIVALAAIDKLNKKHEEKLAQLESELDKIKKELNII